MSLGLVPIVENLNVLENGRDPEEMSTPITTISTSPTLTDIQEDENITTPTPIGPTTRSMSRDTNIDPMEGIAKSISRNINTISTRQQHELRNLDIHQIDFLQKNSNLSFYGAEDEHGYVASLTLGVALLKKIEAWNHNDPTKRTL